LPKEWSDIVTETSEKLALVTGASRGIGAETAVALAAAGYHVVLTARTAAGLEAVEEQIHDSGGSATIAPLDLTDGDAIGRLATAVAGRWEGLDLLVLNAAMLGTLTPVPHIDPGEFARVMTLNVNAQATLIAAFDTMLRKAHGSVIGLTSSVGGTPRAYWGAYGASKAAFETLLGSYADETRDRVRVAIVDPGATRTAMRARAYPGENPATLKGPEAVAERIATLAAEDFGSPHRERIN